MDQKHDRKLKGVHLQTYASVPLQLVHDGQARIASDIRTASATFERDKGEPRLGKTDQERP